MFAPQQRNQIKHIVLRRETSHTKLVSKPIPKFETLPASCWQSILSFLDLKDMFTIQSLSIKLQLYVNPSSDQLLVDYRGQFGVQPSRKISSYGSIMFILQETNHFQHKQQFELNLKLRQEREAQLLQDY
jgi:hypothetical protein